MPGWVDAQMSKYSPCCPGAHSLAGEIYMKLDCIVGRERQACREGIREAIGRASNSSGGMGAGN